MDYIQEQRFSLFFLEMYFKKVKVERLTITMDYMQVDRFSLVFQKICFKKVKNANWIRLSKQWKICRNEESESEDSEQWITCMSKGNNIS